jgi:Protein of unknown function (DUF2846)
MKRFLVLALLVVAAIAPPAYAQNFPGPASPALARLYFYRLVESNQVTRWTGVFLNDQKIGDLGERSYFFRDVQPGTYKVGVTSDVPYQDQYRTVTVAPNSTTFIRVYFVPGYGIQFNAGSLNSGPTIYQPSVFGNRVMDPAVARQEMTGLSPARN